jgi:hypothetical protein
MINDGFGTGVGYVTTLDKTGEMDGCPPVPKVWCCTTSCCCGGPDGQQKYNGYSVWWLANDNSVSSPWTQKALYRTDIPLTNGAFIGRKKRKKFKSWQCYGCMVCGGSGIMTLADFIPPAQPWQDKNTVKMLSNVYDFQVFAPAVSWFHVCRSFHCVMPRSAPVSFRITVQFAYGGGHLITFKSSVPMLEGLIMMPPLPNETLFPKCCGCCLWICKPKCWCVCN